MLPLPQVVDNVPEKISMTILHMPLLYKVYIGIRALTLIGMQIYLF